MDDNKVIPGWERPALSPRWHLRPNKGNGLVYRFSTDESRLVVVTMPEAILLSLCNGFRTETGIISLAAKVLECTPAEMEESWEKLKQKNQESGPFIRENLDQSPQGLNMFQVYALLKNMVEYQPLPDVAHRLEVPLSLLILPTFTCRADCIYCYAERPHVEKKDLLSEQRWLELLIEAGEMGIDLLTFSGGDPMLYPHIESLLNKAAAYRMAFILPTKSLVTPQKARSIAANLGPFGQVQVSIDSFDTAIAAQMTRVPDYAFTALTSIKNLVREGVSVRTNTVITPLNYPGIELFVHQLYNLGVQRAHFTNYYRTHYRHTDTQFLSKEQMDDLNETIRRLKVELNWPQLKCNAGGRDFSQPDPEKLRAWRTRTSCSGGFSSLSVLPDGKVVLCEQVPAQPPFVVGNLQKQSISDVWNGAALKAFVVPERAKFEGTPCEKCTEFDECHRLYGRCFRDAYFTFGSAFAPAPACPYALPGMRMA